MTVHGSSHVAHAASTSASRSGATTAIIRSCDSEIMISHGSRSGSRSGTRSRWTSTPASPRRHLGQRRREPGRAAVLQPEHELPLDEVERHLDQRLAPERVADLHRRPLLVGALEVLAREHGRAADPVAACQRAVEHEQIPGAGRLRAEDALGRQQADAHRVHERIRCVRLVEDRLAADVRDAGAVPVVPDAGDGAAEVPVGRAEAQSVEQRDRSGAHGDDVADDPADAGGRTLERLDRARVVVRLDLERDRDAVAEVDHAGVLAGPLQHALALRRQALQKQRRVLVAAVLRPQHGEDGELEVVRRATEQLLDARELPVGEAEGAMERLVRLRGDGGQTPSVTGPSDGPAEASSRTATGIACSISQPESLKGIAEADHPGSGHPVGLLRQFAQAEGNRRSDRVGGRLRWPAQAAIAGGQPRGQPRRLGSADREGEPPRRGSLSRTAQTERPVGRLRQISPADGPGGSLSRTLRQIAQADRRRIAQPTAWPDRDA